MPRRSPFPPWRGALGAQGPPGDLSAALLLAGSQLEQGMGTPDPTAAPQTPRRVIECRVVQIVQSAQALGAAEVPHLSQCTQPVEARLRWATMHPEHGGHPRGQAEGHQFHDMDEAHPCLDTLSREETSSVQASSSMQETSQSPAGHSPPSLPSPLPDSGSCSGPAAGHVLTGMLSLRALPTSLPPAGMDS